MKLPMKWLGKSELDVESLGAALVETDSSMQPLLSRRGFVGMLGAGALAALGCSPAVLAAVGDDRVLARAWADEQGQTQWSIRVVKRWEVPLYAFDVSQVDTVAGIAGMQVCITSSYNGKTVEGNTDEDGVLVVDVRDLSPEPQDPSLKGGYEFWGSISAEADGYRSFEAGAMLIVGAEELDIATEPRDGNPYLRCTTFAGYDIQYSAGREFVLAKGNDEEHEILVKVADCSGSVQVEMKQGNVISSKEVQAKDGVATISFKHKFIRENDSYAFTPGETLSIKTTATRSDGAGDPITFTLDTTMNVTDGTFDDAEDKEYPYEDPFTFDDVAPGPGAGKTPMPSSFTFPDSFPILGGQKINMWTPGLPFVVQADPHGFLYASCVFSGSLLPDKNGAPDNRVWRRSTFDDTRKGMDRKRTSWARTFDEYRAGRKAADGSQSLLASTGFAKGIDVDCELGGTIIMQNVFDDAGGAAFEGNMQAFLNASMSVFLQQQFILGYIPAFIGFDFRMGVLFTIDMGLGSKGSTLNQLLDNLYVAAETGPNLAFTISTGVSLGIGIAGVVSAAVRGGCYIGCSIAVVPAVPSKPCPHLVIEAGASVLWVVQLLLVKFSGEIVSRTWPNLYDSWEGGNDAEVRLTTPSHSAFSMTLPDGTRGFICTDGAAMQVDDAVVVSEAELAQLVELVGTPNPELNRGLGPEGEILPYEPFLYTEARADSATTFETCNLRTVRSLGELGTEVPETLVFKQVFSDPRMQIVPIENGNLFALRIAPVTLKNAGANGEDAQRTRLTCSEFSYDSGTWSKPVVMDFEFDSSLKVKRADTFDYNFDVDALGNDIWVSLICGTRPKGDDTTFDQAADNTILVLMRISTDGAPKVAAHMALTVDAYRDDSQYRGCVMTCVRSFVVPLKDTKRDLGAFVYCLLGAWEPGKIDNQRLAIGIAGMWPQGTPYGGGKARWWFEIDDAESVSEIYSDGATFNDYKSDFGLISVQRFDTFGLTAVVIGEGHYLTVDKSLGAAAETWAFYDEVNRPTRVRDEAFPWEKITDIYDIRWSGAVGGILCSCKDGLKFADLATGEARDVAFDKRINMGQFGLSEGGDMLYYTTLIETPGPAVVHEDGTREPGPVLKRHQLWASTAVLDDEGKHAFIDPYPLAVLEHSPDQITHVRMDSADGFLLNCITDIDKSLSDVYFLAVPRIVCLNLVSIMSENRFVCAGEKEPFLVTVRNDGNTVISEFKLVITGDNGFEESITVTFADVEALASVRSIDHSSTSGDVPVSESGLTPRPSRVDAPTAAGVLLPSWEKRYRFMWSIPEDWEGEVQLSVTIDPSSPKVSDAPACSELPGVAERALHAYAVEGGLGLKSPEPIDLGISLKQSTADLDQLSVGHNPYYVEGTDEGSGSSGVDDGSGLNESGFRQGKMVGTGDGAGSVLGAALLAALGAGSVAIASGTASRKACASTSRELEELGADELKE